jgi:phage repressor protein C with HTH and peptisase S24 domain
MERKRLGLTLRELAKPIGVAFQSVHNWEKDHSPIPVHVAHALEFNFGVPSKWLLEGGERGSVREAKRIHDKGTVPETLNSRTVLIPNASHHVSDKYPRAKERDYPLCYIFDMERDDELSYVFDKEWLKECVGVDPDNLFLLHVMDDAMYPTLNIGDSVMFEAGADEFGFSNGIWVIETEEDVYIRRVRYMGSGRFQILCDNEDADPFELKEPYRFWGKVVWYCKQI